MRHCQCYSGTVQIRHSGWFAKLPVVKNMHFLLIARAEDACTPAMKLKQAAEALLSAPAKNGRITTPFCIQQDTKKGT